MPSDIRPGARILAGISFLALAGLAACGGGGSSSPAPPPGPTPTPYRSPSPTATPTGKASPTPTPTPTPTPNGLIDHVVVVIQENRSFDNLFHGFPNANTVNAGYWHQTLETLQPFDLASPYSADHTHGAWKHAYDGGLMDGFGDVEGGNFSGGPRSPAGAAVYVYAPQSEVQPYWDLATSFALSDNTFESYQGPSFVSHLFMVAGQAAEMAENPDGNPWGCTAPAGTHVATIDQYGEHHPGIYPCVTMTTIADELDAAGISWRYYAPQIYPDDPSQGDFGRNWSTFQAVKNVYYGPDWINVISPETQVLSDIENGNLAKVTYVVPSLNNSDHPGEGIDNGPSWVTSIVDAMESSQYWSHCAVIVVWDDWGGWYDHVAPQIYDYESLGFRVPLLAISPYAKTNYVSHVQYETASVLRFIEDTFGLGQLTGVDARAGGLEDMFDFTQARRKPKQFRLPPGTRRKLITAATAGAPDY
jgi:phospholipase C